MAKRSHQPPQSGTGRGGVQGPGAAGGRDGGRPGEAAGAGGWGEPGRRRRRGPDPAGAGGGETGPFTAISSWAGGGGSLSPSPGEAAPFSVAGLRRCRRIFFTQRAEHPTWRCGRLQQSGRTAARKTSGFFGMTREADGGKPLRLFPETARGRDSSETLGCVLGRRSGALRG